MPGHGKATEKFLFLLGLMFFFLFFLGEDTRNQDTKKKRKVCDDCVLMYGLAGASRAQGQINAVRAMEWVFFVVGRRRLLFLWGNGFWIGPKGMAI